MKNVTLFSAGIAIGIGLLLGGVAYAAQSVFIVQQGGTGVQRFTAGDVLIGDGTDPIATSTNLTFATSTNRLSFTYGSSTAQSMATLAVTGAGTSTVISNTIQAGCFSTNGTTCIGSGGSGTVTSITNGGGLNFSVSPLVTSGTIAAQLATSAVPTISQVPYVTGAGTPTTLGFVSTSSETCTGIVSCTAHAVLTGGGAISITGGTAGQILAWLGGIPTWAATSTVTSPLVYTGATNVISCPSCNTSAATVTSVASGNGIIGGTITTSGTLSLASYLATSSAETATRIPVWASTGGTPATLSGGFSGYTLTATGLAATNASTTAFTATYASTTNLIAAVNFGVGSSTPFSSIGVATGTILVSEFKAAATSTTQNINWLNGTQQLLQIGTAGVTVTFSNFAVGQTLRVVACNPDTGTAGTITWPATVRWTGGSTPAQTTTANKCDIWSFVDSQATSTASKANTVMGAMTPNF